MGEPHLERPRPAPQAWPGALQRVPQQLDVGVHDRRSEEALPRRDGSRGREAPVLVARGDGELLVSGQHEEGAAEDVHGEPARAGLEPRVAIEHR
jgi:hypothetical protein